MRAHIYCQLFVHFRYREMYLREIWPVVTKALDKVKISCALDLVEGSMTVRTTRQTNDPYIILKGMKPSPRNYGCKKITIFCLFINS